VSVLCVSPVYENMSASASKPRHSARRSKDLSTSAAAAHSGSVLSGFLFLVHCKLSRVNVYKFDDKLKVKLVLESVAVIPEVT